MTDEEKVIAANKIVSYYMNSPEIVALMEEVIETSLIYGEEEGMKLLAIRLKERDK